MATTSTNDNNTTITKNNDTFLVFNTACFGDVLICNSLVQNIKIQFPSSKIVFIVDKPFVDIAKYQKDVDDVIVYDKNGEHKGFLGMFKFIKTFPYKNAKCAFITYKNERNFLISKLIGAKKNIMPVKNICGKMHNCNNQLLEKFSGTTCSNLPIKYEIDSNKPSVLNLEETKDYIVLNTLTKESVKNMQIDFAIDLIKNLTKQNKKVVFVGIGKDAQDYANKLKKAECEFIDLVDKTNILELARVIKHSKCLISTDTGTMHLGYALGTKTICCFNNQESTAKWAPDKKVYPHTEVLVKTTVKEIVDCMNLMCTNEVS